MRVFARQKEDGKYFNLNIATAAQGFFELGIEVIPYRDVTFIYDKVKQEDIVLDGILQVEYILSKFHLHPELCDYPEMLKPYMGRKVWTDTVDHINATPELWNVFIKPVKHKAFTGRAVRKPADLIGCGKQDENLEVLCTELLDIKREFRGFVLYDKLIDIRPYNGDWHYNYDPQVIDSALEQFKTWEDRPAACSLDFAVVEKNGDIKTVFLEQNDAYALGCYGLTPLKYARLISARWAQLHNIQDEFKCLSEHD